MQIVKIYLSSATYDEIEKEMKVKQNIVCLSHSLLSLNVKTEALSKKMFA